MEHEYQRNGVAQLFLEVEPLSGQRHVEAGERRTWREWALWIAGMLETRYPRAERVVLVMDNLNTHGIESLYATLAPANARRLAERLEIHYTLKHGSWLNMAEIELSALCRQRLKRRIPDLQRMQTRSRLRKRIGTISSRRSAGASGPKTLESSWRV